MDDDYGERLRTAEVFVADEGPVVGLIVLIAADDHVLIENVAVDPARQGTTAAFQRVHFSKRLN